MQSHSGVKRLVMSQDPPSRRTTICSRTPLTNALAASGGIACSRLSGQGNRDRRLRPGRRGVEPPTVARNHAQLSDIPLPSAAIHASPSGLRSRNASSNAWRRFQAAEPRANISRARARWGRFLATLHIFPNGSWRGRGPSPRTSEMARSALSWFQHPSRSIKRAEPEWTGSRTE
jgi:hypothetical protein